jgi:hypothetical protein
MDCTPLKGGGFFASRWCRTDDAERVQREGGSGGLAVGLVTMAAVLFGVPAVHALGFPGTYDEPVQPFTAYGTLFKKLVIEDLDEGGHILRRRRGVTTVACVSTVAQAEETPQFQGLPTGMNLPLSSPPFALYSDEKVANRDIRVWHGATEIGP